MYTTAFFILAKMSAFIEGDMGERRFGGVGGSF